MRKRRLPPHLVLPELHDLYSRIRSGRITGVGNPIRALMELEDVLGIRGDPQTGKGYAYDIPGYERIARLKRNRIARANLKRQLNDQDE